MGARSKNFYNDMVSKMGFEAEAAAIQDLYLDGKKTEAAAAVPDALGGRDLPMRASGAHQGPAGRLEGRLGKAGHVGTMVLKGAGVEAMRVVAEAVL